MALTGAERMNTDELSELEKEVLAALEEFDDTRKYKKWVEICLDSLSEKDIDMDAQITDDLIMQDIIIALVIAKHKLFYTGFCYYE